MTYRLTFFVVITTLINFILTKETVKLKNSTIINRKARLIFFEDCTSLNNVKGTCMKRLECVRNGGVASGYCGTFGVCCELNLACNSVSKLKRTTIRNPTPLPTKCSYHFQPFSHHVCQLKVEFDIILTQPTVPNESNNLQAVTCQTDVFQVGDLKICGTNTNQHIYIPFDVSSGTSDVSLTFTLGDRNNNLLPSMSAIKWNLVVTQLECPSALRKSENGLGFFHQYSLKDIKSFFRPPLDDIHQIAPQGCLQYFIQQEGVFESFNYNAGKGPYLGNMRYGICFRRNAIDTGVQLTSTNFEIGAYTNNNQFLDEDCHSIVETEGRSNDYLLIPESVLTTSPPLYGTRYCGNSLQSGDLFHAPPGPFVIYFNSDNLYSTVSPEKAFRIQYSIQ